jgi:hypothetical protein
MALMANSTIAIALKNPFGSRDAIEQQVRIADGPGYFAREGAGSSAQEE